MSTGPDSDQSAVEQSLDALLLQIGDGSLGDFVLPMADVAEVTNLPQTAHAITRVPGMPAWLRGLAGWRGRLVAVCDLARLLHCEPHPPDCLRSCVVLRREHVELALFGLTVKGTASVDAARLTALPARVASGVADVCAGQLLHEDRPLALLDAARLLALRDRLPARRETAAA